MPDNDETQKEPVFYYSRERRLSRASPAVRAMNEGKTTKQGFILNLFGNKSNLVLLFTIIFICASFYLSVNFSKKNKDVKFGENTIVLALETKEESPILSLIKKTPKSGEFYTGNVEIAVTPVIPAVKEGQEQQTPSMFTHRVSFNPVETETYRFSLPFTGADFFVTLKSGKEEKTIRIKAKQ